MPNGLPRALVIYLQQFMQTVQNAVKRPVPVVGEIPAGTVDGTNAVFTLANLPLLNSVDLYRNGLLQTMAASNDYTISGRTITFNVGNVPQPGDNLLCGYWTSQTPSPAS